MKTILVPTDFSNAAEKACKYAARLAMAFEAKVILLHAYTFPAAGTYVMIDVNDVVLKRAKTALQNRKEELHKQFPGLMLEAICKQGFVVATIRSICMEKNVDLVVMGTNGVSGYQEKLFGSNTAELVGMVDVPIIAVPEKSNPTLPVNVLVAADLFEDKSELVYNPLKEIAEKTSARLKFITLLPDENSENKLKLEKRKKELELKFENNQRDFLHRKNSDIERGILNFIEQDSIDLLVVVCRYKEFWPKIFNKSISKALVKHASVPVLVLNG